MTDSDPTLIEEQRRIVEFDDGPLLVVAGPGSGKTRVLAERFVRLVRDERAKAGEILVLAYNAEAASEMARRVASRLGPVDYPIWTFHAFARRTIAELGWLANMPTSFRLISHRVEQWLRIKSAVDELKPKHFYPAVPRRDLRMLQGFISRAKQEAVPPDRILNWAAGQRTGRDDEAGQLAEIYAEAGAVYRRLNELYHKELCFDFDDLILKLAQALDESGALKDALVARYRYFMVDEYQDTNYTQSLLLERLVPHPHNLVVVADDDQSIYKFRGASLANIHRFKRLMPEVTELSLGRNHRSTPEIVGASSALIDLYSPREAKQLRSQEASGQKVTIVEAPDGTSEAVWVAERCELLIRDQGVRADEVAVLARTNAQLQAFAAAFAERGLPHELSGGGDLFYRPEIKDLMALVRAAVSPADDLALIRLLRLPVYALSTSGRLAVTEWLRSSGQSLFRTFRQVSGLTDPEHDRLRQLSQDIAELADLALRSTASEVVFRAMELSRHVGVMERDDGFERYQGAANVRRFAELVELFNADHPSAQVGQFLDFLELAMEAETEQAYMHRDLTEPAIKLYTAHSSKGLEFDHVFVVNASEGRFPIRAQERLLEIPAELVEEELNASSPIDEERRLFYVGMTRARKTVVCTYARKYNQWARTPSEPSQFLVELRGRVPELLEETKAPQVPLPPVRTVRPRLAQSPPAHPFTLS
jgi:DNA helicase-2/ATP-dependent DNA helicase PcrA